MQYIVEHRFGDQCRYSVFNSLGQLMLYTTNRLWAEQIASAFQRYPSTREVVVADSAPVARRRL